MQRTKGGTCLVTGGAGFIGCAISKGLVDRFDTVIAIDPLHPQVHKTGERPAALAEGVKLVQEDITHDAVWADLLSDEPIDCVIHLAAETGTAQSMTESVRHGHTNVVGTCAMLDAFARAEITPSRFVLTSSRAVYGEGAWQRQADDTVFFPGQRDLAQLNDGSWDFAGAVALPSSAGTTPPYPVSVYGATKLAQEHVLRSWARSFGSQLVTLRLQNVYGPGQSLTNSYTGIVGLFCQLARAGKSIPLYEDGEMLRDFILIDDVAEAILGACDVAGAPDMPVDIGTGRRMSLREIAECIASIYGAPAPHVSGQFRLGDVRHAQCSSEEAKRALGWTPRNTVEQGLEKLSAWIEVQLAGGAA